MTRIATSRQYVRGWKIKNHEPQAGSVMRDVYDRLRRGEKVYTYANKSDPKFGKPGYVVNAIMTRLKDFYGMDIRRLPDGAHVLDGEWYGDYYVKIDAIMAEIMVDQLEA